MYYTLICRVDQQLMAANFDQKALPEDVSMKVMLQPYPGVQHREKVSFLLLCFLVLFKKGDC